MKWLASPHRLATPQRWGPSFTGGYRRPDDTRYPEKCGIPM